MNHHHAELINNNPKKFFAGRYTVAVMLEHRGKLLMVQEAVGKIRGKWSQPAGHIELNEAPFDAAIRECREETGYKVKLTGIFRIYLHPARKKHNAYINYTFLARPIGKPAKKITSEIMAMKWYSKKELKNFPKKSARSMFVLDRNDSWLKQHPSIPLTYIKEIR